MDADKLRALNNALIDTSIRLREELERQREMDWSWWPEFVAGALAMAGGIALVTVILYWIKG
jgi:hypothetical protein